MRRRFSEWLLDLWGQSYDPPRREDLDRDYYMTFTTDFGKRVLLDMLHNNYHTVSFLPGQPEATAFNEGQRAVVHGILEAMDRVKYPLRHQLIVETQEKKG